MPRARTCTRSCGHSGHNRPICFLCPQAIGMEGGLLHHCPVTREDSQEKALIQWNWGILGNGTGRELSQQAPVGHKRKLGFHTLRWEIGVRTLAPLLTFSFAHKHLPLANFISYDSDCSLPWRSTQHPVKLCVCGGGGGGGMTCSVTEGSTESVVPKQGP